MTTTVNAAINLAGDGSIEYRSNHATDITVERTGPGVYLITGALGMAASGWRSRPPNGDSGTPMCSVEIDEDPLTVTTLIDGVPADLPAGRVLSLRFDVVLPEPEPES